MSRTSIKGIKKLDRTDWEVKALELIYTWLASEKKTKNELLKQIKRLSRGTYVEPKPKPEKPKSWLGKIFEGGHEIAPYQFLETDKEEVERGRQ